MRDQVAACLVTGPLGAWRPLRSTNCELAWVGIVGEEIELDRRWVWDVVTPEVRDEVSELRIDPLVLPIEQDLIICHLTDTTNGAAFHLPIPVRAVPATLRIPAGVLPPHPYTLELDAGWSRESIEAAIDAWAIVECGTTICAPQIPEPSGWELGSGLRATDSAFGALLALDSEESAAAVRAFGGVLEALADILDVGGA